MSPDAPTPSATAPARALRALGELWLIRRDPVRYARSIGVRVGEGCRLLGVRRGMFGSEPYLVRLGDHVTVTAGVQFVTHDGGVWVFRQQHPDIDVFAPIVIGDNVFIGVNSLILPGVTVGSNSVIGAGAVVTADVPANTVAVGVPARPVRTLDEYWEKVSGRAVHIRSLDGTAKRRRLEEMFAATLNGSGNGAAGGGGQ